LNTKFERKINMTESVTSTDTALRQLEHKFLPEKAKGAKPAVIGLSLSGESGGEWHLVIADGEARIHLGAAESPAATIKASATDFLGLLNGTLDGARMMMTGKLRASGNLRLLTQFGEWFAL
jgi:putative sterol carrier protein